jgi:carboxylesterase type B
MLSLAPVELEWGAWYTEMNRPICGDANDNHRGFEDNSCILHLFLDKICSIYIKRVGKSSDYKMVSADMSESRPSVTLPQGTVVGIQETGAYPGTVESFKGIPYALPPTGDRRFRPPIKVEPSSQVIDASKFGPRAPAKQFLVVGPKLEESEDCLTVNVFRPAKTTPTTEKSSLLPVAVYIHGGAFNRGNAAMHDTGAMVGWSEAPFIGVSFGYRIGALGFLPSRLSAEEGALNLGLKDQICLLEWVQENIAHFGGDKQRVTLFGLSAGAHSVSRLEGASRINLLANRMTRSVIIS